MYTNNKDLADFNLESDYDEEEIIESDEYYDGDEAEGYYDDEYADEEYYDEEYPEEYPQDEYYDEGGYNYPAHTSSNDDDTLNKILDEIALLKRSVVSVPQAMPAASPAPIQPVMPSVMPPIMPPMPYMPFANHAPMPYIISAFPPAQTVTAPSNEPVIYNELARIREELVKTQNSHEMFVEVTRLKDNMRLDAKINESRLQEQIIRLNNQISMLQSRK